MTADFPAAHSMDTDWYAIDRDGHVAHFASGEGGAVPADAGGDFAYRVCDGLTELYLTGTGGRHHVAIDPDRPRPWVRMFLTDLELVRPEIGRGVGVDVNSDSRSVFFRELSAELSGALHEMGACRGCFVSEDQDDNGRIFPARLGLFGYSVGEQHATPYERDAVPESPLHVDELPPDLRRWVTAVRFGRLCFAETTRFQPAEEVPCRAYGSVFLTVDGRERPIEESGRRGEG